MKKNLLILILSAVLLPVAASAQNIQFEEYDLGLRTTRLPMS